jgi:NADP-dependent 3-hydroxy acid dehydrogenase YdfG
MSPLNSMTTADQLVNSADAPTKVLQDCVALVTGATSGIGRAIALALVGQGARAGLIGRDANTLENVLQLARNDSPHSQMYRADLTREEEIRSLVADVDRDFARVDILVHCAGAISHGEHANASVSELDALYAANVRGPYLLTQLALPLLRVGPGQIVFVNSSSGLKARARAGQFSATQHAMKAIADSLRDEVNADGIRVLSVFPGRTATPRTEKLFHEEGKAYRPELLMQPEDVATMVIHAINLPRSAEVTEIAMRPLYKSY